MAQIWPLQLRSDPYSLGRHPYGSECGLYSLDKALKAGDVSEAEPAGSQSEKKALRMQTRRNGPWGGQLERS